MKKIDSYEEREKLFWSKVDIKDSDSCWNYKEGRSKDGYGQFWIGYRTIMAHRFAFESATRRILLPGELVLHKCDNPPCCNPKHLYCGTHSDNAKDMYNRERAPLNRDKTSFKQARFYAGELWLIRRLKIEKMGYIKKTHKFTQRSVAKMFKVSHNIIGKIWRAERYPCKEGYYVYF